LEQSPKFEGSGVLSRWSFGDGHAEARITPFAFSVDADAKPVWSIIFAEPSFTLDDVQGYLDTEIDIEVFAQQAILYDVLKGAQQGLGASRVTVDQTGYDAADYQSYLVKLEAEIDYLHNSLRKANAKNNEGRALLQELLRRADIKAAASDHLRERQAAAIEVLKRLQTHFED
jgi:hypothetical protein